MADLAAVLSAAPGVRLRQGRVGAVAGTDGKYVHIDYAAGRILNAGRLDDASYAIGDYVWFLLDDEAGALVLGKQTPGVHDTATVAPPSPLVVDPTSSATYDTVTDTWSAGVLTQSPTQFASWFYAAGAFASLAGYPLGAVEIEVVRTGGGPVEFTTHQGTSGSGPWLGTGDRYARPSPPVGVATWLPLPLDWGAQLADGSVTGVALGGGTYSGTYSGTGRVRLSPTV